MDISSFFDAVFLGILEGLTEFLPISSTGHLIVATHFMDFEGPKGKVFEIVIQLGAILAICWCYRVKLLSVAQGALKRDASAWHFIGTISLAFLPAVIIGLMARDFIKEALFAPYTVSIALIVGGILILLIERFKPAPKITSIEAMPYKTALMIGLFQTLGMIPGVSRAGATIMGALICKLERKTAAEFSFFLAIPTMVGASVYDLYKSWEHLNFDGAMLIAVGFIAAFISAVMVVRFMLSIVTHYGFAPFAVYRILFGGLMLSVFL
jgi:undecaprenyl-diphosphatase